MLPHTVICTMPQSILMPLLLFRNLVIEPNIYLFTMTHKKTPRIRTAYIYMNLSFYEKCSLGQKLFELLVRSGYLNGKFTCPKKKSLVH
jgi:hypothetical protein